MTLPTPDVSEVGEEDLSAVEGDSAKVIEGRSPMQLAMARLRKDRMTQVALALVAIFVIIAIVAPILDWVGVLDPTGYNNNLIDPATGGLHKGSFGGISWSHPLGLEPGTGRDLLSRLLEGMTFSLVISVVAMLISIVLGTLVGIISGFLGGKVDFFLSRFVDLVLCFPQTLMLLALSGTFIAWLVVLGVPAGNVSTGLYVMLILGLFGWPAYARVIRSQVMSLRNREFVEAARSLGSSNRRIYFTEILPNLWPPILVYSTLILPINVSAEAALSYLGVGIKAPTPTLGNILTDSVNYAQGDFMYFLMPAVAIMLVVLAFNLVGDGLGDAIDPKRDH